LSCPDQQWGGSTEEQHKSWELIEGNSGKVLWFASWRIQREEKEILEKELGYEVERI